MRTGFFNDHPEFLRYEQERKTLEELERLKREAALKSPAAVQQRNSDAEILTLRQRLQEAERRIEQIEKQVTPPNNKAFGAAT